MRKLGGHGDVAHSGMELLFGLGWRDVADGLKDTAVVEPVHPFGGCVFHGVKRSPCATPVDQDPQWAHALQICLKNLDFRDRKIHHQSHTSNPGTKQ